MRLNSLRLVLVLCASLVLAACGSGSSSGKTTGQAGGAAATATPAGPPVKLTVSIGSYDTVYLVYLIAKDGGIFQKNGLDVDLQVIPGAQAVAAMIAGQVRFGSVGPGETIGADVGGADLVIIGTTLSRIPTKMYAPASIKTASDLIGKKAAVTNPGSTYDVMMRQGLTKMGLQPDKDVTLIATGSITNVTTALLNGAVSAAPLNIGADTLHADAAGFHSIYDLENLEFATQLIAAPRSYVSAHHDVAQRFIDSYVEASARLKNDKPFAIEMMKKYAKIDDQATLDAVYGAFATDQITPQYPFPKAEQFTIPLQVIATKNDKVNGYDVNKVLDPSLVQSAQDRKLATK